MQTQKILFRALIIIALLAGAAGVNHFVPPQHLPWRKLDPQAPLGFATKSQFMRLSLSPSSVCMDMASALERLSSSPAEPNRPNETCGWTVARDVVGAHDIKLSPHMAQMQCPLSVGAYLWMREAQRLSLEYFGEDIVKIHHYGTYSCRRQNGNKTGRWSEHAFANAWDIAGFELRGGTLITVQKDWNGPDEARREFLRSAHGKACKLFKVVLGPDYNAAHHDHFHFNMGPSATCR